MASWMGSLTENLRNLSPGKLGALLGGPPVQGPGAESSVVPRSGGIRQGQGGGIDVPRALGDADRNLAANSIAGSQAGLDGGADEQASLAAAKPKIKKRSFFNPTDLPTLYVEEKDGKWNFPPWLLPLQRSQITSKHAADVFDSAYRYLATDPVHRQRFSAGATTMY